MKITVTMNDSDYIKFNEYYMQSSTQGKRMLVIYRLIVPIVSIIALMGLTKSGVSRETLIAEIAILTTLSVVWFIKSPKLMLKVIGKSVAENKKDGKLPYTENAVLEFLDDAMIETTDSSMKKVHYSEVSRVGYTDEHIFIFFGSMEAFVIPKRCITDVQSELEALLQEKIRA